MSKLDKVLAKYHKYLTRRKLAKEAHVPHLVRWVRQFRQFARALARKSRLPYHLLHRVTEDPAQ